MEWVRLGQYNSSFLSISVNKMGRMVKKQRHGETLTCQDSGETGKHRSHDGAAWVLCVGSGLPERASEMKV